ncbi:single-stranded-DNA-specific exonuclease RecJ [Candidatus Desantisbacteria bacterium CG02_land_8_20_14_3_00_49_13]|nr:MAG: single-stranded-DNA-specific exonuclease RecJ [Candidatus Desantisbacteria bacterium CG02_land_8_20_14_3_00_49_13]
MKWNIAYCDENLKKNLANELGIPMLLAQMLMNRGIMKIEDAFRFISPQLKHLHDPFLMKGMKEGVDRLKKAIQKKEQMCIYGDYDTDGISGAAVLFIILQKLGANVISHIPHRIKEGYGLNADTIKRLSEEGTKILITVDCGITSVSQISLARQLGMDVILTDHHQPLAMFPPANIIINPKQSDCPYPFKELAGVGVAFKLCQALDSAEAGGLLRNEEHLDLVALGTIADLVPLRDENRIFVKYGLESFSRTTKPGLKALGEVSGTDLEDIDASHIGFKFAPRINAGGRMGDAKRGLSLLLSKDFQEAMVLATMLNEENRSRQRVQEQVFEEAQAAAQGTDHKGKGIIVISSDKWHRGVIGIVASRLVEEFSCPVVVISIEDGVGYASARSVEGINIMDVINEGADLLYSYGGHKYAAGFTVKEDKIAELKEKIESAIAKLPERTEIQRQALAEAEMDPTEILSSVFKDCLRLFSPFGKENPYPVFIARDMRVISPQVTGSGHLRILLEGSGGKIEMIGFRKGDMAQELSAGIFIDVVFSPHIDKSGDLYMSLEDFEIPEAV